MLRTFALLFALTCAGAALAQYKWIDKDGRTGFGDSPPRDAKSVQRLDMRGGENIDASQDLPYELRRAVERFPVTLYTSASCQPCDLARSFLRNRGIPHSERTVGTQSDAEELKRVSGGIRLPVMAVGRQVQVPFDPDAWTSTLDAAGYPRGSMLPRSYQPPMPQPLTAQTPEPAKGAEPAKSAAPAVRQ
jgi:glutaredoxin